MGSREPARCAACGKSGLILLCDCLVGLWSWTCFAMPATAELRFWRLAPLGPAGEGHPAGLRSTPERVNRAVGGPRAAGPSGRVIQRREGVCCVLLMTLAEGTRNRHPTPPSDTLHFGLGGCEKPGEIDDGLPEISAVAQISNSQPFFLRSQL